MMDGMEDYYEQPSMARKRKKKKKKRGPMGSNMDEDEFESPFSKTAQLAGHHLNYYKEPLDSEGRNVGTDADLPNNHLFASEG